MTTYIVSSGLTSSGVHLSSGDAETVLAHGTAEFTVVSGGGVETVSSGGVAHDDKVLSGGVLSLASGGAAYNETISAGGELEGLGAIASLNPFGGAVSNYGLVSGVQIGLPPVSPGPMGCSAP